MDRCGNLRQTEDGTYEDSITFEPVDPARLISFTRGAHRFCYDAVALMKFLRMKENEIPGGRNVLPETNDPLTEDELTALYERGLSFFPEMYVVAHGDVPLPYSFTTEETAIRYVRDRNYGSVFAYHLFDDPEMYHAFYPHGLESMRQVFGIRGPATPVLRRQSAVYTSVPEPPAAPRQRPQRSFPLPRSPAAATPLQRRLVFGAEEMDESTADDLEGGMAMSAIPPSPNARNDIMQHARRLASRARSGGQAPQRVARQRQGTRESALQEHAYRVASVTRQLDFQGDEGEGEDD